MTKKRKYVGRNSAATKLNGHVNGHLNGSEREKGIALSEVRFYRANEKPFGAFSNLFRRPIEFEGTTFPTAEHAYQAGKASKPEVREWILSAPSPALVAMAAHGLYTWDIVPNWNEIKLGRMRKVLEAKFTQHPDLRQLLLSTGDARLVEAGRVNSAVNKFWGEVNGNGKNMLGVLLMELRAQLAHTSVPGGMARTGSRVRAGRQVRTTAGIRSR